MDDFLVEAAPADGGAYDNTFSGGDAFTGGDEFSSQPVPDSGFVYMAPDATPSPIPEAAPSSSFSAVANGGSNPLIEFNKQFREQNEQKDTAEREAKAARRTAGKSALKAMLADRKKVVDARTAKNREDESTKVAQAEQGLHGEPWARVSNLIDVTTATATAAEKKKHAAEEHVVGDTSRMKDVLIAVKNTPPPTA